MNLAVDSSSASNHGSSRCDSNSGSPLSNPQSTSSHGHRGRSNSRDHGNAAGGEDASAIRVSPGTTRLPWLLEISMAHAAWATATPALNELAGAAALYQSQRNHDASNSDNNNNSTEADADAEEDADLIAATISYQPHEQQGSPYLPRPVGTHPTPSISLLHLPCGQLIDCKNTLQSHSVVTTARPFVTAAAAANEETPRTRLMFDDEASATACNDYLLNSREHHVDIRKVEYDPQNPLPPSLQHNHRDGGPPVQYSPFMMEDGTLNVCNHDGIHSSRPTAITGLYDQLVYRIRHGVASSFGTVQLSSFELPSDDEKPTETASPCSLESDSTTSGRDSQYDRYEMIEALLCQSGDLEHIIPLPVQVVQGVAGSLVTLHSDNDEGRPLVNGRNGDMTTAPVAPWRQTPWMLFRLNVVAILALGIVLSVLPTDDRQPIPNKAQSMQRQLQIVDYINNITLTGHKISLLDAQAGIGATGASSVEAIALRWLIVDDPLQLMPSNLSNRFRLQQRYALATLWTQQPRFAPSYGDMGRDECNWVGISCATSTVGGVVTEITLSNTSWRGTIVPDMGLLSNLVHFDMARNFLIGTLPNSIGYWTNLLYFDVSMNALYGSLPSSIGSWTCLKCFEVSRTVLGGALPHGAQEWTSLERFGIYNSSLTGILPVQNWPNLSHFNIWGRVHNQSIFQQLEYLDHVSQYIANITLSDPAMDSTEELTTRWLFENELLADILPSTPYRRFKLRQRYALATLWVQQDPLSTIVQVNGTDECDWSGVTCKTIKLGKNIGLVKAVTEVKLAAWRGSLPSDLGLLSNLVHFDVSMNHLTGSLPDSIGLWTSLKDFSVQSNSLTGSLPFSIGAWTLLEHFQAYHNYFTGKLPMSIGQWSNVTSFDAQGSGLDGPLPESIGMWSKMTHFSVRWNHITGSVPDIIMNWTNIRTFCIDHNPLVGSIPGGLCVSTNLWTISTSCGTVNCPCGKIVCKCDPLLCA